MHRILHIVSSLAHSGTTSQLALLAAGLPRDAFRIDVCALDRGGPMAADLRRAGATVSVIGRRWKFDPMAFWRLVQHIGSTRPHLVHTWLFSANSYGRLAARTAGVRRTIATERSLDTWKTEPELDLDRYLARKTNRWVANSQAVADFYTARGLPLRKLVVIPSGVKSNGAVAASRDYLLAELGLARDAKLIGFVGPLIREKRLKPLIWAADQLQAVGAQAHLLVVGEGPLRPALERYCRLNQIEDRVHFLGQRDDLHDLLASVDVVWQSGALEGQSSAILEAMAASKPVIATDSAGNRELVVPGETGYLVPPTEKAGFARCTLPLLENPDAAQTLGQAARNRALQYFGAAQMVARYAALYRELLA